jgi:hypothetical protein
MDNLFFELIKKYFQIHFLESQLVEFSNSEEKNEYLNFVMDEFEKKQTHIWVKILGIYNKEGKVYGYDKFDMGTMGFYIDNPDEINFNETTFGMKVEMNLNDFIRQCRRLLKYSFPQQTETKTDNNITGIDKVFIDCLKQPVFARLEYLENEQIKSNFSKETYLKILYDKWKEYKGIVFKKDLEIPFDELVKTKGWEYAAITVYGDEPEPFEHIYSEIEFNEIETENIFKNTNQNSFEWLNENILWLLRDYIYRLYDKWDLLLFEGSGKIKGNKPPQQTETKTEQETIEMKPVLKPEAVQVVFEIIKDFFSTEQQPDLKQVIETGNIVSKKLLFKGNGNRLTDTFKKLIEHDFITGCQKQDLINWIISNFTFTQQNKVKAFIYDTVEKTISRNDNPCKSPLIIIENCQIRKVEHPRTKKYNKY